MRKSRSLHGALEAETVTPEKASGTFEFNLAELSQDNIVIPFRTERSGVLGKLIRLGTTVDQILKRHDYPDLVGQALGEALALTAMLGTALKFDGRLILQTRTDGPLRMLVVNFDTPSRLRGYASFDEEQVAVLGNRRDRVDQGRLLGHGHLALTIDPGGDMDRHQGIVALEGQTLSEAAHHYFRQSEQLPTFIRLAVARHYEADGISGDGWAWRAGGLLLQHVTKVGGKPAARDSAADAKDIDDSLVGEDDDDWQRPRMLASTVEDHELLDPTISPDRLLYRLLHEEGVRVNEVQKIKDDCPCTRDRVTQFLNHFGTKDLDGLREPDGGVTVTCEFCATAYRFEPEQLRSKGD